MIYFNQSLSKEKSQTGVDKLEQIDTPLDQDFPSGRVTELTEHLPINHWHESAVALASQVRRQQFQINQVK